MKITLLANNDSGENHENLDCVFTSSTWLKLHADRLRLYGVVDNDELQAVFALHKGSKMGLTLLENSPLTPHCGLVLKAQKGNASSVATWKKDIMEVIVDFIDNMPWTVVSVCFPPWITDLQPFIWRNYKVIVRYTYLVHLKEKKDEESFCQMLCKLNFTFPATNHPYFF